MVTINVADLVTAGRLSASSLDPTLTAHESATLKTLQAQLAEQRTAAAHAAGRLAETQELIKTLQQQLKVKDAQIDGLTRNLTQLIASTGRSQS